MCGIVGVLSSEPVNRRILDEMRDTLAHRGPDHAGSWSSSDGYVAIGHRRLAIIDLSEDANQPFLSADHRFTVTFNGEIYNFRSVRRDLEKSGVQFSTQSDTEVLVEAYRYWGSNCLEMFSGMFAFAIWDSLERVLFCARDRVGEKPFYYAEIDGCFVFASELKALCRWPGFRKKIHYPALIDYLTLGFVADPKSIWEGCYKLPPGYFMSVRMNPGESPRISTLSQYWDMEFREDTGRTDWSEELLDTLVAASKELTVADVPVGTFLSGGVDSSAVTVALSRADCPLTAFTVGFQEEDYDERHWARVVAREYDVPHVERVVRASDVENVLDKMLWHYDEPFNDYSYIPTYYLCREAKKHITVALSGDGGDELLAGYLKYQRLGRMEGFRRFVPAPISRNISSIVFSLLGAENSIGRTVYQYGQNPDSTFTDMLSWVFPENALKKISRGPLRKELEHYRPSDTIRTLLKNAPSEKVGLINSMRYLDLKLTLAGDILVKVDRASMAVSLEVRPVLLHKDVIALAERIPSNQLAGKSHSKEVLKSALREWLPADLLYRKKQGFAMPLRNWLQGNLDWSRKSVKTQNPVEEFFDTALLRDMENSWNSGQRDLSSRLHSVYFLRNWLEKWVVNHENSSGNGASF